MANIGVNIRVTAHCNQGGRKYMEDTFSVAYQQSDNMKELQYAYFGIFDGHGGSEAALFAKDNLINFIVCQDGFWSDRDEDILRAIHDGYIQTHYSMWKHHEAWPRTASGLPSTSGTTATIAFIRRGKLYIGHVGDSCVVLGYQEKGEEEWKARPLTIDHKPETQLEINRIMECGGKVVSKSGVPRVVWNRPRLGHKGPVRRSTPIDEIPFLAVARALGDFWSYNSASNRFVVSPEPDVSVHPVDVETFRCLILGTDGLWNMLSPRVAVSIVQITENHNEKQGVNSPDQFVMQSNKDWTNPSKVLVDKALRNWTLSKQRADNTSVVTLLLDRPGPPKPGMLENHVRFMCTTGLGIEQNLSLPDRQAICNGHSSVTKRHQVSVTNPSSSGLAIFTRYSTCSNESTSPLLPFTKYASSSNLISEVENITPHPKVLIEKSGQLRQNRSRPADDSDHINRSYRLEPEISISNIDSPFAMPCEKKKHTNSTYNFRFKQKFKLPEKDDKNNDVENMEQWSQMRWNDSPSSNSHLLNKSKLKRRCNSEQINNKHLNWSCSDSISMSLFDKSYLHHKQKSFQEATTSRVLRSDTIANAPVRTLRSRNIDLSSVSKICTAHLLKPRNEELKVQPCVHRPNRPKTKCMRSASFSSSICSLNKRQSVGSYAISTRSSSKKIVK